MVRCPAPRAARFLIVGGFSRPWMFYACFCIYALWFSWKREDGALQPFPALRLAVTQNDVRAVGLGIPRGSEGRGSGDAAPVRLACVAACGRKRGWDNTWVL